MAEYTGEVIQDAAGAKPYTGEVIPLAKPAAPASAAPDKPLEQSTMDFISGNLNKGIAGLAGLPVDTARNVANLGIAAYGAGTGRGDAAPEPLQGGVGSS